MNSLDHRGITRIPEKEKQNAQAATPHAPTTVWERSQPTISSLSDLRRSNSAAHARHIRREIIYTCPQDSVVCSMISTRIVAALARHAQRHRRGDACPDLMERQHLAWPCPIDTKTSIKNPCRQKLSTRKCWVLNAGCAGGWMLGAGCRAPETAILCAKCWMLRTGC